MITHQVLFHNAPKATMLHGLLRPGFRHCLMATRDESKWVVRDFERAGDHWVVMDMREYGRAIREFDTHHRSLRVLEYRTRVSGGPLPRLIMSCAEVTAHRIGLWRRLPWTPYAIYRELLARGATQIHGEPA